MYQQAILNDLYRNLVYFGSGFGRNNSKAKYIKLSVDRNTGIQNVEMLPTTELFDGYVVQRNATLKKSLSFLDDTIHVDLHFLRKVLRTRQEDSLEQTISVVDCEFKPLNGNVLRQIRIESPNGVNIVRLMNESIWQSQFPTFLKNINIEEWQNQNPSFATIYLDATATRGFSRFFRVFEPTEGDKLSLRFDGHDTWLTASADWGTGQIRLASEAATGGTWTIPFDWKLVEHLRRTPAASSLAVYPCPVRRPSDVRVQDVVTRISFESLVATYTFHIFPPDIAWWRS